jgi:hypothetical protein
MQDYGACAQKSYIGESVPKGMTVGNYLGDLSDWTKRKS